MDKLRLHRVMSPYSEVDSAEVDHRPLLVTGGAGFIGTHVCRRLQEEGRPYVILDLHEPPPDLTPAKLVLGDVRNPLAVEVAIQGCHAVLHLAAAHHDSGIDERTYFAVNEFGTENIVAAMHSHGIKKICFFSSAAVYGISPVPACEDTPPAPLSAYGRSKLAGEHILERAVSTHGISALVVRPSVTFGEGNYANMYALIKQIESGRYAHVGESKNYKSLSYVDNLVDLIWWAWSRHRSGFDLVNWVESPDLTSRQIAEIIADQLGARLPRFSIPLGVALAAALPFEIANEVFGFKTSISRMRIRKLAVEQTMFDSGKIRALGFKGRTNLETGLRSMVSWYQSIPKGTEPVRRIPPFDPVTSIQVRP